MNELLTKVIEAHGGMANWATVKGLTVKLSLDGPFWDGVGWPEIRRQQTLSVDARHERTRLTPFVGDSETATYESTPELVRVVAADGSVLGESGDPRRTFPEYGPEVKWDRVQLAYFTATANWNYFVEPFLFTYPGVQVEEIEPWQEGDETWRRLRVTFPAELPNHNPEQTFYYDERFLLRRMDYAPDVTGGGSIAHYVYDPETVDGLIFYRKRMVHLRAEDGTADRSWAPIEIGTDSVVVQRD